MQFEPLYKPTWDMASEGDCRQWDSLEGWLAGDSSRHHGWGNLPHAGSPGGDDNESETN